MSESVFLKINNLKKDYNGFSALKGIDMTLNKGDFLTIFGPNGAGKTTLLRIISTLLPPSSGQVRIVEYDLEEHPEEFRKSVAVISHQSLLYNDLSAQENLEFYAALYGVKDMDKKVKELLRLVGLYERRNSQVSEFSRGMQQRLSIARALINDPYLILLDEPYSGLDQHAATLLKNQLALLHSQQRTIIMVTHNLTLGMKDVTKVGILVNGKMPFFRNRDEIDADAFNETYFSYVSATLQ